jgi:hypothetical protein
MYQKELDPISPPLYAVAEGGGVAGAGAPARKCSFLINIYNFNKNN